MALDGWQWRRWPLKRKRGTPAAATPPYECGAEKVWYTWGVRAGCGPAVLRSYLLALLQAEQLAAQGILAIPHGGSRVDYERILAGKQPLPRGRKSGVRFEALRMDGEVSALGSGALCDAEPAVPLCGKTANRWRPQPEEVAAEDDEEGASASVTSASSAAAAPVAAGANGGRSTSGSEEDLGSSASSKERGEAAAMPGAGRGRGGRGAGGGAPAGAAEVDDVLSGLRWGPFVITPKQPSKGHKYGGWQARCPFHKKSSVTGCKKFASIWGPTPEDREQAMCTIKAWCVAAPMFDRQWQHLRYKPPAVEAGPAARAASLLLDSGLGPRMEPPTRVVLTDSELDARALAAAARDARGRGRARGSGRGGRRGATPQKKLSLSAL